MRFLRRSLVGVFLMSLTVGLLAWAGNTIYAALQTRWEQEDRVRPSRERVFAVNVVTVEPTTIAPVLTSYGEVRSRRTLDLRATTAGRIIELADEFNDGGEVTEGQLLARLDPQDAQSALDVVLNDVSVAEAELRDAARGVDLAADELASANEQVELREKALTRQTNLLSRGVGTEAAVETAELAASSARQAVLARRQSSANAAARLDQAKTALARRAISMTEAERTLGETEIHADFSGTLAEVSVVEGGLVANNERIAQIVDSNALEVSFRVSTSQYARLLDDAGNLILADIEVSLDVFGVDLVSAGVITRESAAVGAGQTGRLLFAQMGSARGFRPGDFVTVSIEEPELTNVARLPATAVDSSGTVLVIVDEDRLAAVKTEVLRKQGDDVIVKAQALVGKSIVAARSPLLGEGIKVRPIPPAGEVPAEPEAPAMVELDAERRAKLVAFIEANTRMPDDAKARVLGQLKETKVPAAVVERIESRMGG